MELIVKFFENSFAEKVFPIIKFHFLTNTFIGQAICTKIKHIGDQNRWFYNTFITNTSFALIKKNTSL